VSAARRSLGWLTVLALAWVASVLHPPQRHGRTGLVLLGPVAPLLAEVQWLRFQAASLRGHDARALELAEGALALAPERAEGWERLAAHLLFDRASRERQEELADRRTLFQAGMAVLARGIEESRARADLEFFRALAFISKATTDPELDVRGPSGLYGEAVEALERAAAEGDLRAEELLPHVRALGAAAE
jgi:hypothetical protein